MTITIPLVTKDDGQKPIIYDLKIVSSEDALSNAGTLRIRPTPCTKSCLSRSWSILSAPFKAMHSSVGSALLTVASIAGIVATAVISSVPFASQISFASYVGLGYFGQTVASHIGQNEEVKKPALITSRIQQHTSLATMMLTGFYSKELWAIKLNCTLLGMMLRLKFQKKEELDKTLYASIQAQSPEHETAQPQFTCRQAFFATAAGVAVSATGFICMYALGQLGGPRVLSLSTACAMYGLQGLGFLFGRAVEQCTYIYKDNCIADALSSFIIKTEGIGLALCYLADQVAHTNLTASFLAIPVGFLLGTSSSRISRINSLQEILLDLEDQDIEPVHNMRCTRTSVALHALAFVACEVAGACFYFYGTDDTLGYEVFFPLTPLFYAISRFFSKRMSRYSSVQSVAHTLLQKSPQVISAQINFALSLVRAGAIERTTANLRIFFVFQALLMGSTEAALFELDALEDTTPDDEQMISDVHTFKRKSVQVIKNEITRNHARVDMIVQALANSFHIRV